ncbi:Hypothetical predicted protein [Pelobates cultripes]|uniref:Uncharacterized protein n=1 Tax=Pelobates cultripes TaxID=61616 RepID=A0AAD1W032_PELCU|nr:Hypothetical predicted protein [Pelobates cultripes]
MDGFLQSQRGTGGEAENLRSAPPSPASTSGTESSALDWIGEELRSTATSMATKTNLLTLTTTIQDALRAEMAVIRMHVSAQAGRIQTLEHSLEAQSTRISAMDAAINRQGELLLSMRHHMEDLDNWGRRCNIWVRGVLEANRGENAEEILSGLFKSLLQNEAPQ